MSRQRRVHKRCLGCSLPVTLTSEMTHLDRLVGRGMTEAEARALLPRCQRCLTVYLRQTRETVYRGLHDEWFAQHDKGKWEKYFRYRLHQRDKGRCQICLRPVDIRNMQLDHIHPRSLGGPDTWDNLQCAHGRCNIRKGNHVQISQDHWIMLGELARDRGLGLGELMERMIEDLYAGSGRNLEKWPEVPVFDESEPDVFESEVPEPDPLADYE